MSVTIRDAIIKSMKAYWKDKEPQELGKIKPRKYTKKYLDSIESEYLGKVEEHASE